MTTNNTAALLKAAKVAAETFRRYEALHRAKLDNVKAYANRDLAVMMEAAIEQQPQQAATKSNAVVIPAVKRRQIRDVLLKHHQWHQEIGMVRLVANEETGLNEPVDLDMSLEYQDSTLCEETEAALYGITAELSPPAAGEQVERVTAAIYDAFHNSTLPSMQGKLRTAGDMKDYVTKLVLAALPTPPDGGTE